MNKTISSVEAILLCVEFFSLGGSLFAHREGTKTVLRIIMIVFAILAMSV